MKYAVLKISGHQYKVSEGETILVDKLPGVEVKPDILMVCEDDKVKIGKPLVEGAKVTIKVLEEVKGEKIEIYKFKAKSRYRKHTGFRAKYTKLLIEKIS